MQPTAAAKLAFLNVALGSLLADPSWQFFWSGQSRAAILRDHFPDLCWITRASCFAQSRTIVAALQGTVQKGWTRQDQTCHMLYEGFQGFRLELGKLCCPLKSSGKVRGATRVVAALVAGQPLKCL